MIFFSFVAHVAIYALSNIAGDLIEVGTDNEGRVLYKMIRIILMSICPRELHVLMMKPVKEGEFEGSHGRLTNVMYSIITLRHYWHNWLRVMARADMSVCPCKCCTMTDDLHDAYAAKRRKIICAAEILLDEMDKVNAADKAAKAVYKKDVNTYKDAVLF